MNETFVTMYTCLNYFIPKVREEILIEAGQDPESPRQEALKNLLELLQDAIEETGNLIL